MKGIMATLLLAVLCRPLPLVAGPVHDDLQMRCLDCHVTLPFPKVALRFHTDMTRMCLQCHDDYPCQPEHKKTEFKHPVEIVPRVAIPADMPLDEERKMSCMTCHVYHDGDRAAQDLHPKRLRRPQGRTFCYTCHARL